MLVLVLVLLPLLPALLTLEDIHGDDPARAVWFSSSPYPARWFQSPLRQFGVLPGTVLMNLEAKGGGGSGGIVKLLDMDAREVGALCHNHRMGDTVRLGCLRACMSCTGTFFASSFFFPFSYVFSAFFFFVEGTVSPQTLCVSPSGSL